MDAHDLPKRRGQGAMEQWLPGRLIGLQGRLARPFWGVMGIWSALCGALASSRLRWDGGDLLTLALVLLLADLAWGSLWDLAVGTDWRRLLAGNWSTARPASLAALPYTQPDSPGGRLFRGLNRLVGWWREAFWPVAGPTLLGLLAGAALTTVLTLLLPERLRPLNVALVVFIAVSAVQRWRGQTARAGQALVQVGLSWFAGHAAFAGMSQASVALAISLAVAAWGVFRVTDGRPGGLWLLNGGQVVVVALLAVLKQPLAAGAAGLLLFGQIASQPALGSGGDPARIMQRTWPWLMAVMLVAALAIP
jgi:hypothetical protein